MNSAPVEPLIAESDESSLYIRKEYLCDKYTTTLNLRNSSNLMEISKLIHFDLTNKCWQKKTSPTPYVKVTVKLQIILITSLSPTLNIIIQIVKLSYINIK